MKIATALYPITWHADFEAYADKVTAWVEEAAGQGADLLVFPEYAGVEAALLGEPDPARADRDWVTLAAPAATGTQPLWGELADTHNVHILAGSAPTRTDHGIVNRAALFAPDRRHAHQDKQILTPWERANTALCPGIGLRVFDTEIGRIGVLICYDAEFPAQAAALRPDVLLVTACTDTHAGAERLRVVARARALENQCVVVLSSTTGDVPACDLVDENHGVAGIYTPPDTGFPATGILAESAFDAPGWTFAQIDLATLPAIRQSAAAPIRADTGRLQNPLPAPEIVHLKP